MFGFSWMIAHMPLGFQIALGKTLGWLLFHLYGRHKKIADTNLKLCFPHKSKTWREQIIKENAYLTGQGVIETSAAWFSNLNSRHNVTSLMGQEHLDKALEKGKGVILLGFHMTSLEIGAQLLSKRVKINGMYKPDKNPLIENFMYRGRLRHMESLVKQKNVRKMLKILKDNKIVWYAADQDYGKDKSAVFAPFFGIPASTITATTKFAKMTGATVIPFTQKRVKNGKRYELTLHPALENFPGESPLADATRLNHFLEEYLKQEPADYFWVHKRFKTRPDGEDSLY